ncbi:MAG: hypothetical protein H7263_17285 [Candidatus Sericytochromatia bacterium]|nr:hypothetical protein [Candidatus Sericytochromatia bacterium]
MTGIDNKFANNYVSFKLSGLDNKETNQLKSMVQDGKIDLTVAKKLGEIISKDHINNSDKQLLILIGESSKDKSTAKKFERSIDPLNSKISQLIESGFKSKHPLSKSGTLSSTHDHVESMSSKQKITQALNKTLKYIPENIREKVSSLFTPDNIAIMGGTLAVWAGSHTFGAGEIADVALTGLAVVALGKESIGVVKDLYHFAKIAYSAKNDHDLENAAKQLAHGISTVLVDTVAIAITKKITPKPPGKITFNNSPVFAGSGFIGAPSISISASTGALTTTKATGLLGGSLLIAKNGGSSGKVSKTSSSRDHTQVKPKDIKSLKEGGNGTVVTVKSVAEAESLIKKSFPEYKQVESFGHISEKDLARFPEELANKIKLRWKYNHLENNTVTKLDMDQVSESLRSEIKGRWNEAMIETKKGSVYYKDYNITDHPKLDNGHGHYPHINVVKPGRIKLEIRIDNGS